MLALLGRGLWKKAELIWSGRAKPVSSNGLSETHGRVWSGLVKSCDLGPGGSQWSDVLLEKIGSMSGKEEEK